MLSEYFNNKSITDVLGGQLKLEFIPGASSNGTTESLASLVTTGINLLLIILFVVAVFVILKSAYKRVTADGESKPLESASKAVRNAFVGILVLVAIVVISNIAFWIILGVSLFEAPSAFRECGGVSLFSYRKDNPGSADQFVECVGGQFR